MAMILFNLYHRWTSGMSVAETFHSTRSLRNAFIDSPGAGDKDYWDRIARIANVLRILFATMLVLICFFAWQIAFPAPLVTMEDMPEMTYRGMNIAEFAALLGVPADSPYTIAVFEELCATEDATGMER